MADKVTIEIDLDTGLYEQKLKKTEDQSQKTGSRIGDAIAAGIAGGLAAAITTKALGGVAKLSNMAIGFFGDAIKAANESDTAIQKMNLSLALVGDYSAKSSKEIQNFASNIEKTIGISDETTLNLVSLAKSFGATNEQAMKIAKTATNLAATGLMDVESATVRLAGTLNGSIRGLDKLYPSLKNVSDTALKSGVAIDKLSSRFDGLAEAMAKTPEGKLRILTERFNSIVKDIGKLITHNPALVKMFEIFSDGFMKIADAIKVNQPALTRFISSVVKPLGEFFLKAANGALELVKAIAYIKAGSAANELDSLKEKLGGVNKEIKMIQETGAKKIMPIFGGSGQTIEELQAQQQALTSQIKTQSQVSMSANQMAVDVQNSIGSIQGVLSSMQTKVGDINTKATLDPVAKNFHDTATRMNASAVASTKTLSDAFKNMDSIVMGAINNMISHGLTSLGAALVGAGKGFGSFAKSAAGIMGDFFIQMGMTIIAADQAIIALKASLLTFFGGLGVAAGIGLVIAGGALKALAGGPASVGSVGGAGGGIAAGISEPNQSLGVNPVDQASVERAAPNTAVNVNVSGVITNPRETAQQIADLLKDGFDTSNLNVRGLV